MLNECHSATTIRSRRAVDTAAGVDLPESLHILQKMMCLVHAENVFATFGRHWNGMEWEKACLDRSMYTAYGAVATR